MKPIFSKIRVLGTAALALFLTASCSDILDEQPRSSYDPTFFKTEKGVEGGVTSMYAHLRYIYGQAYYYNSCLTGTDEATWGWSADGNFKDADLSGVGNLTATTCRSDALWGTAFSNINTANGVIENGAEVGVNESLVSEARFFRAFDYFLLVQTFGGVPLDLGSGELKFNITPSRTSVRNTVPEVYTKAIFPDLLTAIENLPANPRVTGGVTKTVARLYLAKAYLTYAWWLKNPNNIPTYPECQRTDPDGHDAAWYFQQAYDVAVTAIENPGPFGLQESFWMVNAGPNDRNMEILLYADHTQEDEYYNGGSLSYGGGGAPDNFAGWMMNWNYTDARSADNQAVINRIAEQCYGRPWTPENKGAKYPKPGGIQSGDNPKYGSTLGYFDSSYWKVRNITLGYNFEKQAWLTRMGVQSLRAYLSVQNPFIICSPFHKETGLDPETNSYGNENVAVTEGIQKRFLTVGTNSPSTRNYLFGINLTF
jgi:starch-binding outer membrane protein, SusD/RagB family